MPSIIDTDVAIHLRDQNAAVVQRMSALDARPILSVITQIELENGVYADPQHSGIRRGAVDLLLANFAILPFDANAMLAYRAIVTSVGFSRRKVADRMIAATAIAHELSLITMNRGDFSDIPGLALTIWPSPA